MNSFEEYQAFIKNKKKLLFLTGAGISTLSGIKDFRSSDGLYSQTNALSPETILSSNFFYSNPDAFFEFYKNEFDLRKYEPNVIHKHIANLENEGKEIYIVTQNVDGLHQKAGSRNVIEYHGTIYENSCTQCQKRYSANFVFETQDIPLCAECGGIIRPEIVLYGEGTQSPYSIMKKIGRPEAMIVLGTSLTVSPANTFIYYCVEFGVPIVIINRDKTPFDDCATILINDDFENIFRNITMSKQ